jgi:hypothetical protein
MMTDVAELETHLRNSLERFDSLIAQMQQEGTPKAIKAALVAQGQLSRAWERFYAMRAEGEQDTRETPPASQEKRLESLRALLRQYRDELDVQSDVISV